MTNPWMKKNPWMSMWLSAANTAVAHTRSRAHAEANRQISAATTEGSNQIAEFWRVALGAGAPPKKRKRR